MTRLLAMLCLLLVVASVSPSARAQPTREDPIARGVALRRQGKNAEALLEFRRAYEQAPSPRALAQIALAEQALGAWPLAERDLIGALGSSSDPWIARNLNALQTALETVRDHLSTLYVETDVPGAFVSVAGEAVGSTPLKQPLRVVIGEVEVAAQRPGEPVRAVRLSLLPRQEHHVTLTLSAPALPTPAAVRAEATPVVRARPNAFSPVAQAPAPDSSSPPASSRARTWLRTTGTIALTLSGALLVSAVAANLARHHYVKQYNDSAYCGPGYDCARVANAAHRYQTLMIAGYASAGALVVMGAALLIAGRHRDISSAAFEPYYFPRGGGLAYRSAF